MNNKIIPTRPGFHVVGFVKSAHGIRGEIYVQLSAQTADWLEDLETLGLCGLEKGAEFREYEVDAVRAHKDGLIVKLVGVNDRNQSELLRKQSVFIPEDLLVADEGEGFYLKQIEGFELRAPTGEVLGVIAGFATNGVQDLLRIRREGAPESLVPFVEAFLRDIDFDKKIVTMDLPEGLFEL